MHGITFYVDASEKVLKEGLNKGDVKYLADFLLGSAETALMECPWARLPPGSEAALYITVPMPGEEFTMAVGGDTSPAIHVNGSRVLERIRSGRDIFGTTGPQILLHEIDHLKRWERINQSDRIVHAAYKESGIPPRRYYVARAGIELGTESPAKSAENGRNVLVVPGLLGEFGEKVEALGNMGKDGAEYFRNQIMMEFTRSDAIVSDVETVGGMMNALIALHLSQKNGTDCSGEIGLRDASTGRRLEQNEFGTSLNNGRPVIIDLSESWPQRTYDALDRAFNEQGPMGAVMMGMEACKSLGVKIDGHDLTFLNRLYESMMELDGMKENF